MDQIVQKEEEEKCLHVKYKRKKKEVNCEGFGRKMKTKYREGWEGI